MATYSGMDVSSYQGDINWKRIKASAIEFAIIRASYGYGSIDRQTDARFHENAYEAAMEGLLVGAYHTTYAATPDEVKKEAELFLKVIDGYRLAYPVAVNMEDYMLRYLPPDRLESVAATWISELRSAGYYPMIFGTPDFFGERLKKVPEGGELWISEPGGSLKGGGMYGIRQYTLGGRLDGVLGLYNLDLAYKDYAEIIYSSGFNGFSPSKKPDTKKKTKSKAKKDSAVEETAQETVEVNGDAARLSMSSLHTGDQVDYCGPVYRTSRGWFPHTDVGGTFTLTKLVNGRKAGAKLDQLGWVPVEDLKCTPLEQPVASARIETEKMKY